MLTVNSFQCVRRILITQLIEPAILWMDIIFFIKRLNKGVTERPDFPKVEDQAHPGGSVNQRGRRRGSLGRGGGQVPRQGEEHFTALYP